MVEQYAVIAGDYSSVLNTLKGKPSALVEGKISKENYENSFLPVLKLQYLSLLIIDISALKNIEAESIGYLKASLPQNVRLVVLAPGLKDTGLIRKLYSYGVYDLVMPDINTDEHDDATILKIIENELYWKIEEPTSFAKVREYLDNPDKIKDIALPEPDKKEKPKAYKPRLTGFAGKSLKVFEYLEKLNRYNIVEESILKDSTVLSNAVSSDIIALDNIAKEKAAEIVFNCRVNKSDASVVAGYTDRELYEDVRKMEGVKAFMYNGSPEDYARGLSVSLVKESDDKTNTKSKTISVIGCKGGSGATTISALMAKAYAKEYPKSKVLVIDYSTRAGDLESKFSLVSDKRKHNLYECVASFIKAKKDHMDLSLLKDKVLEYCHMDKGSGIYLLTTSYTDIFRYTDYRIKSGDIAYIYRFVLNTLKDYFDVIILDVTKYGGFTYEIALELSDRILFVSDASLSGVYQALSKIDEAEELSLSNKSYAVLNKTDLKHNEKQFDNYLVLKNRVGEKLITLPFDKHLFREKEETGIKSSKRYTKALKKMWSMLNDLPLNRKD